MSDCLTAERLRSIFRYDPDTGEFTRLTARRGPRPGSGQVHYNQFTVDGVICYAHRMAWLYVYGKLPAGHIDHINGDKLDNRIANLRDVSQRTNRENRHGPASSNKLGILGVSRKRNKFAAYIKAEGKTRFLGSFATPEAASAAYLAAKRRYHPGCTI